MYERDTKLATVGAVMLPIRPIVEQSPTAVLLEDVGNISEVQV